jgi:Tfp pilus assembly protein PilF
VTKRDARRWWPALALILLGGCAHAPALTGGLVAGTDCPNDRQAADVQFALGRAMEKQGDATQALTAYQEAMRRDPSRADAALHAAALLDQQGKFVESEECYRKAEAARPGSADVACNRGYSLYVQQRWDEAEASLRQALTRQPDHRRAHNNLGLVLARTGRSEEALSEFRKAGLDQADAHVNLAFALTLQEAWPQARAEYALALAADPSSAPAKKGLEELNAAQARLERPAAPAPESRPTAQ